MPSPALSHRSRKNRRLLGRRVIIMALWYVLPAGGLALFFLKNGLNDRISAINRERRGAQFIEQVIRVHNAAVNEIWTVEHSPEGAGDLRSELMALHKQEKSDADAIDSDLAMAWEKVRVAGTTEPEHTQAVRELIRQAHNLVGTVSDQSGLTVGTELETNYLSDVIAFAIPVHMERLLELHAQLKAGTSGQKVNTKELEIILAGVFDDENLQRVKRGTEQAIADDRVSDHVADQFQREYPVVAAGFLKSINEFSARVHASKTAPLSEDEFDELLRGAYTSANKFWRVTTEQLDVVLADELAFARSERNDAIMISVGSLLLLIPLTWLYFRSQVRPLIQDMVDEVSEAASASMESKNQFLAMMSHEIRTPMNGVIGFANLLSDTTLDDQQRDFVQIITTSGESLLAIINDILDFSKLEANRAELELRPVGLREITEDVLDLVSAQARAKQLELIYWIEPEVPETVLADETAIRQILTNLVGNAVKFTANGHVEIAIGCPTPPANGKAQVSFAIRDTGIGIRPDRLDKLFKPFSQVDSSVNRTHGGTGLGLAICHRLVTLMGGTIAVTTEQEKGSEFTFTLTFPETTAAPELTTRKEAELKGKAILVVDDYASNRRLFKNLLERHGALVTVAASAEEALTFINQQTFDLAALDYVMPEMNGITLGKKIRHDLVTGLPLVLVSSVVLPQGDVPKGVFDEVITKPVKNSRFSETLARVLLKQKMPVAVSTAPFPQVAFGLRHPLRILAVDDNPVNIKVISLTLTSMGYAPVIADSAAQALERLQTEKFDLVLMDIQMPGMDGHEATRVLRSGVAGEINRHVRVCALSAGALAQERIACAEAGMEDFIPKPVTRPVLTEKLAAAFKQKSETLLAQGFKAALSEGRAK